jgi:hypothetical protein
MPPQKKVCLGDLVLDYALYPRHDIDSTTVVRLLDALEAGESLPPIVACSETMRVIDGFHRVTAYRRLHEDDPKWSLPCDLRKYETDRERFADAWRLNARHGRALSNFDIAHCIVKARDLGMQDDEIVTTAAISERKYRQLIENKLARVKGKDVALKRTLHHYAGQELPTRIQGVNERAGGMQQRFYVNQVIDLVKNRAIDLDNSEMLDALKTLHGLLHEFLADLKKKAM